MLEKTHRTEEFVFNAVATVSRGGSGIVCKEATATPPFWNVRAVNVFARQQGLLERRVAQHADGCIMTSGEDARFNSAPQKVVPAP